MRGAMRTCGEVLMGGGWCSFLLELRVMLSILPCTSFDACANQICSCWLVLARLVFDLSNAGTYLCPFEKRAMDADMGIHDHVAQGLEVCTAFSHTDALSGRGPA
jgi:hypothetical protein